MRIVTVLLIALALAPLLLLDFTTRSTASKTNADLPRTAIVFTGQFDRIHKGLDLLTAVQVDQLFITGVNPKAGLRVARFAEQFELTPEQADWISTGRIVLATDANSTLGNAVETACWLERQPPKQTVTLITSKRHMARASLALERAVAPVGVIRVLPDLSGDEPGLLEQLTELRKFLTTWAITLLPRGLWPLEEPGLCRSG